MGHLEAQLTDKHISNGSYSVGIRPQDIRFTGESGGGNQVRGALVEPLGNETLVHCEGEGLSLVVSVDGHVIPSVDDLLPIELSTDSLHFFDRQTGARVE